MQACLRRSRLRVCAWSAVRKDECPRHEAAQQRPRLRALRAAKLMQLAFIPEITFGCRSFGPAPGRTVQLCDVGMTGEAQQLSRSASALRRC